MFPLDTAFLWETFFLAGFFLLIRLPRHRDGFGTAHARNRVTAEYRRVARAQGSRAGNDGTATDYDQSTRSRVNREGIRQNRAASESVGIQELAMVEHHEAVDAVCADGQVEVSARSEGGDDAILEDNARRSAEYFYLARGGRFRDGVVADVAMLKEVLICGGRSSAASRTADDQSTHRSAYVERTDAAGYLAVDESVAGAGHSDADR